MSITPKFTDVQLRTTFVAQLRGGKDEVGVDEARALIKSAQDGGKVSVKELTDLSRLADNKDYPVTDAARTALRGFVAQNGGAPVVPQANSSGVAARVSNAGPTRDIDSAFYKSVPDAHQVLLSMRDHRLGDAEEASSTRDTARSIVPGLIGDAARGAAANHGVPDRAALDAALVALTRSSLSDYRVLEDMPGAHPRQNCPPVSVEHADILLKNRSLARSVTTHLLHSLDPATADAIARSLGTVASKDTPDRLGLLVQLAAGQQPKTELIAALVSRGVFDPNQAALVQQLAAFVTMHINSQVEPRLNERNRALSAIHARSMLPSLEATVKEGQRQGLSGDALITYIGRKNPDAQRALNVYSTDRLNVALTPDSGTARDAALERMYVNQVSELKAGSMSVAASDRPGYVAAWARTRGIPEHYWKSIYATIGIDPAGRDFTAHDLNHRG